MIGHLHAFRIALSDKFVRFLPMIYNVTLVLLSSRQPLCIVYKMLINFTFQAHDEGVPCSKIEQFWQLFSSFSIKSLNYQSHWRHAVYGEYTF